MPLHKLTNEQRRFAEQRHNLVYTYLRQRGLDVSDYYDVAIFGYLKAVQLYCEQERLRRYSFSTIAYWCMRSAVSSQRRKKQINALSLNAPVSCENDLTLDGCIAARGDQYSEVLDRDEAERVLDYCTTQERSWFVLQARGIPVGEVAAAQQMTRKALYNRMYKTRKKLRAAVCEVTA